MPLNQTPCPYKNGMPCPHEYNCEICKTHREYRDEMPGKEVMPLIANPYDNDEWRRGSRLYGTARVYQDAIEAQRDADQKWSDDRLEAKEGELNEWRKRACAALLRLAKSEAREKAGRPASQGK